MSILFAFLVTIFLIFLPTMMAFYYRAGSIPTLLIVLFNLLAFITAGLTWFVAFIIAVCSIRFSETIKSILFALFLIGLAIFFAAAEFTGFMDIMGAFP